jgi:chromosome segregation ATPase
MMDKNLPSFFFEQKTYTKKHRLKSLCFLALLFGFLLVVDSADAVVRRYAADEDNLTALREMRDTIDSMRHEVNNHETEIRMFSESVTNQEATLSSIRQQLQEANQQNKDQLKGTSVALEVKIANLEAINKSLMADMSQLKNHANDFSDSLTQYKQKIGELEKMMILQNHNIDNIQEAIHALVDALQLKDSKTLIAPEASSSKSYRIKPGDSLEKIARSNNTSVKVLKELNNLVNDRINVGQTIQLP